MTYPSVIWAHPLQDGGPCEGWDFQGWWHVDEGAAGGVPYTGTDLYDAVVKENERLRDVLLMCQEEIDQYIWQEYPLHHPVHERYRRRDFEANPARVALK